MNDGKNRAWTLARLALTLALAVGFLWGGYALLRSYQGSKLLLTLIAVCWGVGSVALLYFVLNEAAEALPRKAKALVLPLVFAGPALVLLFWFLVFPTLRTLVLSFMDATGTGFAGLDNFKFAFTDPVMREGFLNNLLWLVAGTGATVGLGLLIAVLADRSPFENVFKALIFMPMAISFVGASVIWKFMYAYKGEGTNVTDIGLLNAVVVAFGGQAQAWLLLPFWNNFLLILIMVWLQTGYAMVILSSAIKGIPSELLEAARVDGANEIQIFSKVIVPSIVGSIVTVSTTIMIFSLKLFDIVRVMTGGNYGTNVIANEFYMQQFTYGNSGRASAIAIVLLLAIFPVLAYNLKQFSERKAFR
ncbi:MAG: sugar ABC transporter permease [Spirochaetes bacterium]|nr:sugar ABC transporter permease [Spirochaetota bacterium]